MELGRILVTRGVNLRMREDPAFAAFVAECLHRHASGDWGDLSLEDKRENELAVRVANLRVLSAYQWEGMPKIWMITEADRSTTTVLFPDEY